MKNAKSVFSIILISTMVVVLARTGPAYAGESPLTDVTLKQCYELALKRSETVAIQAQVIKEAQAHSSQAFSTVLPQINFDDTEKRQDGSGGGSFQLRSVPQRQFTLTQPLFSGFKEFAAIAASRAERRERQQELIRAQQLLFTDVSDAFYLLKNYQENLQIVMEIEKVLKDRQTDLKKREALGRSRESDVASTEAKLYENEAEIESVRSQKDVAQELLEFLIGRPVKSLADDQAVIENISPEENYLFKADERADVRAAVEAVTIAQKDITVARAGYFPTVSLAGNYYTKRVGASSGVDWDAALEVSVPLFDGFKTKGDVAEAKALRQEAKLRLSQTRRQAALDIRNAYTILTCDQKQMQAYQKAAQAAKRNYDLQAEDYRNNLVSNLDVLQALEDWQTMRQSYSAIKNETQRAYWNLKVAAGDIPDDAF